MADLDALLADLAKRNARVVDRQAEAAAEMRDRDALVRQAKAAGGTWDQLVATGITRDTVSKALKGR